MPPNAITLTSPSTLGQVDTDERVKPTPIRQACGTAALAVLVLLSLTIVVLIADRGSALAPSTNPDWFPGWLAGPLGGLVPSFTRNGTILEDVFTYALIAMFGAYLVAIRWVPSLRARWAIAAIVTVHLVFFLAPPLSLTDVFNYLNYGRMEIVYHLNPYATAPIYEPHSDPAFLLSNWHHLFSPYGPLFTILTFALVPLGIPVSLWVMKGILMCASLGIIALVWRSARLLGRDPVRAIVFVGLNPVVLVFGLGGDHNDFIMVLFVMLGVYLLLRSGVAAGGPPGRTADVVDVNVHRTPRARLAAALAYPRGVALPAMRARVAAASAARRAASGAVGLTTAGVVTSASGAVAAGAHNGVVALRDVPAAPAAPSMPRRRFQRREPAPATPLPERLRSWLWPPLPLETLAGAALIVAVGVKASAAILLPVIALSLWHSPRRLASLLLGMAVTTVVIAVASYSAFGLHIPDLSQQGELVTAESLPNLLGLLLGQGGETYTMQQIIRLVLVLSAVACSVWAWRRREFLLPAAWVTIALLATLSWVLPWYVFWLLPLAALVQSKVVQRLALVFTAFLILVWVPIAGSWYTAIGFYPNSTKVGAEHAYQNRNLLR